MADETILANYLHRTKIAYAGELDKIKNFSEQKFINGTDIRAGFIVTSAGESNSYDVDLPADGEAILGPVLDYNNQGDYKAGYSLGDTIGDNKPVEVLNRARSGGRIKCQLVLSRSTTTAASAAQGAPVWAEAASGKITLTNPGDSTGALMFVGYLADALASGTADKVVGVWV